MTKGATRPEASEGLTDYVIEKYLKRPRNLNSTTKAKSKPRAGAGSGHHLNLPFGTLAVVRSHCRPVMNRNGGGR